MSALPYALTALWVVCVLYLAWRTLVAMLRIRWARNAYPTVAVNAAPTPGSWRDRCRGCFVGLAVGDALGLPSESLPPWLVRLRYPSGPKMRRGFLRFLRKPGDISDDTQLCIAVARSIDRSGRYEPELFIQELARWSYFRIGAGRACRDAALGARRRSETKPSARSKGNGAAIRVAPIAMSEGDLEKLVEIVRQNAQATHRDSDAVNAAIFMAGLLHACLHEANGFLDNPDALLEKVAHVSELSGFPISLSNFQQYSFSRPNKPTGHVAQCIPAVVHHLLQHGSDFEAAMRSIFFDGGDTDSIAALVGACIGAQMGESALSFEWKMQVQHRDYLLYLADRLATPSSEEHRAGVFITIEGDIAQCTTEVVVNAWNRNLIPTWLLLPQGVSKAIRKAGGKAAIRAIAHAAPLPLGTSMETAATGLQAKWLVHTDAINLAWRASEHSIRKATRSALQRSHWLGATSLALPLLGSGSGNFSQRKAAELIEEECRNFLDRFDRIEVVVFPGN